jgi:hypothetical protein
MPQMIHFDFQSEEERNEFLRLNDLRLTAGGRGVLDLCGNLVGRLADPEEGPSACRVDIRGDFGAGVRSTTWWLSSLA